MNVEVSNTGSYLTLSHSLGTYRFYAIWLKDNSLDNANRDPRNKQRHITLSELPHNLKISKADTEGNYLFCSFYPENKQASFALQWLLDDEGKVPGMVTPPFAHFAPILQDIVDDWHPTIEIP